MFNEKDITKQIDKAMGEEMQKTIDTLNEFVDKVKLANSIEARREKNRNTNVTSKTGRKALEEYSRTSNVGRTEKMRAIRDNLLQQQNAINDEIKEIKTNFRKQSYSKITRATP